MTNSLSRTQLLISAFSSKGSILERVESGARVSCIGSERSAPISSVPMSVRCRLRAFLVFVNVCLVHRVLAGACRWRTSVDNTELIPSKPVVVVVVVVMLVMAVARSTPTLVRWRQANERALGRPPTKEHGIPREAPIVKVNARQQRLPVAYRKLMRTTSKRSQVSSRGIRSFHFPGIARRGRAVAAAAATARVIPSTAASPRVTSQWIEIRSSYVYFPLRLTEPTHSAQSIWYFDYRSTIFDAAEATVITE